MANYAAQEPHPPGYNALLWLWIQIFGVTEPAVRSLSGLCIALAAGITFYQLARIKNLPTGLIAALLIVVSNTVHTYAQEARPYALLTLLCTAATLLLWRYIRSGNKKHFYWWVALSAVAMYVHLVGVVLLLVNLITYWWYCKPNWKYAFISTLPILGALPFVFSLGDHQFHRTDWLPAPPFEELLSITKAYLGISPKLFILLAGGTSIWFAYRKCLKPYHMAWLTPFVVLLLSWLISQHTSILSEKYQSYLIPTLFSGIVLLLADISFKRLGLGVLVCYLFYLSLNYKPIQPKQEDWREAVAYVVKNRTPNTTVVTVSHFHWRAFAYYYNRPLFESGKEVLPILGAEQIYFAPMINEMFFEYQNPDRMILVESHLLVTDPENITTQTMRSRYQETENHDFPGIRVSIWERQ